MSRLPTPPACCPAARPAPSGLQGLSDSLASGMEDVLAQSLGDTLDACLQAAQESPEAAATCTHPAGISGGAHHACPLCRKPAHLTLLSLAPQAGAAAPAAEAPMAEPETVPAQAVASMPPQPELLQPLPLASPPAPEQPAQAADTTAPPDAFSSIASGVPGALPQPPAPPPSG